ARQLDVHAFLAHRDGVVQALDRVGGGAAAVGREELQRHDLGIPRHARYADAVVAGRGDGAGGVGAVAVVVHRVARRGRAVGGGGVDPVDVINVAVVVVVDPVTGDLAGIVPHVGRPVLVRGA